MWRLLLLMYYTTVIHARKIFIAAPNTLHLDTNERIAIVPYDIANKEELEIYLQDLKKTKSFSSSKVSITNGRPSFANIYFKAEDLPDIDLIDHTTKLYVFLVAKGVNFYQEFKLLVEYNAGYVFLQTDKPIYNPQQDVQIRVIPLNEKLLPKNAEVQVKIKNPQKVIVYENTFLEPWKVHSVHFPTMNFKFPPYPLFGEWSIEALYGHKFQENSSVSFQLEEYVLPTFTVKLETPNVILPQHDSIGIRAIAEYVYGKKVTGSAIFKICIKNEIGNIIEVGLTKTKKVDKGEASFSLDIDEIKNHPKINRFPYGSKLIVEVSVTDMATGNKEIASDDKTEFAKSPYLISFKDSLKDFKPGLISAIMADITFVNGKPAPNVPTLVSVVDSNNNPIEVAKPSYTSDRNGHVLYHVNTPIGPEFFTVSVTTNDRRYEPNQQFTAKHILRKSVSKGYIAISRTEGTRKLNIRDKFTATIFTYPPEKFHHLFFLVIAQGKILYVSSVPKGQLLQRQLEFAVTADMAPISRVVVFSLHENELVVDSLRVFVENECSPLAEVKIQSDFRSTEPGSDGKFLLRGEPDTKVGILAVDNAVYALRNKDRLTKEKLFKTLATRDLGCGPGGGINSESVLSNAGLVIFGNFNLQNGAKTASRCIEKVRRKREVVKMMVDNHADDDKKQCCYVGTLADKFRRPCEERAEMFNAFIHHKEQKDRKICVDLYLECCKKLSESKVLHPTELGKGTGEIFDSDLDFIDESEEDEFERTSVRRDFRETWLFRDYIIGPGGTTEVTTSLPHSITTWIIQAVSVSSEWGICISKPEEVISFKNIFLHLNLPYSVVRNEQIELQATVFNYNAVKAPVTVYMYGVENLCTGVSTGEKSERKKIWVDAHSAESVGFPIVPLKSQEFSLRVVASSPIGSDVVIKKLNVVPEGAIEEEDIVIALDPTNQQKRERRSFNNGIISDTIEESQQLQVTAVKLRPSKDYIPGTESCVISAIGTEFGPTVETVLHDPETLIRMPVGCGEQLMMYMGPTLYTLTFLKVKRQLTLKIEGKIYDFIREGYKRELTFRKADGSYGAWIQTPSSTWLTAFIMKIFCQASKYIFIDKNVICSGIKWLISQQHSDGSFQDAHPVYHRDMMGGNNGKIPMTAFVLISLQECNCELQELSISRLNAELFLELSLPAINDPYIMAMVAYALSLSSSKLKLEANRKLKILSTFNKDLNQRHWIKGSRSHSIEVAAYALLTQLELNDLSYSLPIVNWLNSQRLVGGSFPSTQDTVIALQALSQYSIKAQLPDLSLICNVTSSNDKKLAKTLEFQRSNALILQQLKVNKVGGTLFFHTVGKGMGSLSVKLRYNVPYPVEKLCKFEITVDVSKAKEKIELPSDNKDKQIDIFDDSDKAADKLGFDHSKLDPADLRAFNKRIDIQGNVIRQNKWVPDEDDFDDEDIGKGNSKVMLKVTICTRYLSNRDAEMSIIDAGIFSGFKPVKEDLDKLINDTRNPVDRYELAGRGIIFYLDHISHEKLECLSFRIRRDYVVGNVQATVIKVYDYYNNDDFCTKFYRPDSNSPILQKICEGAVCQCAEGGCPPQRPFSGISKLKSVSQQRQRLLIVACEKHHYVWLGKINSWEEKNGFLFIDLAISEVLKAGSEPKQKVEGSRRTLMMRDGCKKSNLFRGQEYIIMGNDGEPFEDKITKKPSYRYLLDKTTKIQRYASKIPDAEDKILQKALIWLRRELKRNGCNM